MNHHVKPLITTILVFNPCLLSHQITVIGNEMCVQRPLFANVWSQIEQIQVIFTHLEVVNRGSEAQLQVGEKIFFKCSAVSVKVGGSLCSTKSKYLRYGRPHSCGR